MTVYVHSPFVYSANTNTLIGKMQNTFTMLCIKFLDNFKDMVQST